MIFLVSCLDLCFYLNPALRWCLACRLKPSHLVNFILQVVNFSNSALCVAISSFVLNILGVSCCWTIRWGVALPRQKNDVARASFWRRLCTKTVPVLGSWQEEVCWKKKSGPLSHLQIHHSFYSATNHYQNRSISGLLCRPWDSKPNTSYKFTIFETSATAVCSTTGIS